MKRIKLLQTAPCEAPANISEDVQAVSQIVEVAGRRILDIDLFYEGKLRGRYFADKEEQNWAANVDGKWYTCRMNNVARLCRDMTTLKGDYYYCSGEWGGAS